MKYVLLAIAALSLLAIAFLTESKGQLPNGSNNQKYLPSTERFVLCWVQESVGGFVKVRFNKNGKMLMYRDKGAAISEAHDIANESEEPEVVLPIILPE